MWKVFLPLCVVAGLYQTDGQWDIFDIAFIGFALFSALAWAMDSERHLPR